MISYWAETTLQLLNVFVSDILPLFLQRDVSKTLWIARRGAVGERGKEETLTPLFQLSQKDVTPMSNPTPNANAPAKMEVTYTPKFMNGELEVGEDGKAGGVRTVSLYEGIVERAGELEVT